MGDDFVFLRARPLPPPPRTPEPTSLAHPGREAGPELGERGFPPFLTQIGARPSPGRISLPAEGFLSVMFTRNGENCKLPVVGTGTGCRRAPTTLKPARRPQPGPVPPRFPFTALVE